METTSPVTVNQKRWEDQPDACLSMPTVLFFKAERLVEVRAGDPPSEPHLAREYLVTTGNLFGSQTLRTWGEDKLFEVLSIASSGKKTSSLPSNVEIVE